MLTEAKYSNHDMLFDTVGTDHFYHANTFGMNWSCGASYFVRGSTTSAQFFENVSPSFFLVIKKSQVELMIMEKPFYPVSGVMAYLCRGRGVKCGVLTQK